MNAERRQEIGDDVVRDELELALRTCEIAVTETGRPIGPLDPPAPVCGRRATWWSDDVAPGTTVWMCEPCAKHVLMEYCGEDIAMHGVDDG